MQENIKAEQHSATVKNNKFRSSANLLSRTNNYHLTSRKPSTAIKKMNTNNLHAAANETITSSYTANIQVPAANIIDLTNSPKIKANNIISQKPNIQTPQAIHEQTQTQQDISTLLPTDIGSLAVNNISVPIFNLQSIFNKRLPAFPTIQYHLPSFKKIKKQLKQTLSHKKHLLLTTTLLVTLIFAGVALVGVANSKPKGGLLDNNVIIGGIDVSQQYPSEAKKNLLQAASKQKINFDISGKNIEATANEVGLTHNINDAIDQAESNRKSIVQKTVAKNNAPIIISLKSSVDQDKLNKFITDKLGSDLLPTNASLILENSELKVNPGKNGLAINTQKLANQLNQIGLTQNAKIKTDSKEVGPAITTELAQAAYNKAESMISAEYSLGNDSIGYKTIPHSQKVSWLRISPSKDDKNINVEIDADAAKKSFENSVGSFNQKAKDTTQVILPDNSPIILEKGYSGISISPTEIATATTNFINKLTSGSGGNITFVSSVVPEGTRSLNGPSSGKMILVDVPKFKAYAIENGNIINQTLVSTGQKGGETPSGIFAVKSKVKSTTMKGCNAAFGCWSVPHVPNVMTFDGQGRALHGAYWHNSFGKANLSHGCVNLPLDFAEWLYDWTPVGTPVVIVR